MIQARAADSRRDPTSTARIMLTPTSTVRTGSSSGPAAGVEYARTKGRSYRRRGRRTSRFGWSSTWDGAWQVATAGEIAIPFRTLRYPTSDVQSNFPQHPRNEQSYWSPMPRQYDINRISLAGELQNLRVPPQRNLPFSPYVLGQALHKTESARNLQTGDIEADLKYSVTPSMTLDLTVNTDFAQVEVDDQQINLDRFALFFPEKRPFFLENPGLFSVGQPGSIDIFFSRRIGLGDSQPVPIVGGGRLPGKIGTNSNIGFLNMQTQSVEATGLAQQNFTVGRFRQDLANRSNIGVIFVNRQATGSLAGDRDYNRTYAFDGRFGVGQGGTLSGFAARTDTPGKPSSDAHSYAFSAAHETEQVRLNIGYTEVAPNFNPEVGFLARNSYRRVNATVFATFRPENFIGIHELRPHVTHNTFFEYDTGLHETQLTHIDNHWEWRRGHEVHTGMNISREGVFEAFEISPGVSVPPGTYDHMEAQFRSFTNRGAPVSASLDAIIGGQFGGDRVTVTPSIAARVGETVNASVEWSHNDFRLPGGAFTTNLGRLRLAYSFTTRMFLQALVQYNDRADLWSSNIRFGLLSDANTGLFVVYNDIQGLGSEIPSGAGRTLTLKYSYLFDLLR